MKFLMKELIIGVIFGVLYALIEIAFRGYTHPSMIVVGGLCGILIGLINDNTPDMPIFYQCLLGSVIVTIVELISGYYLNIVLQLHVWDYSNMPMNFLGQICFPFSMAWFLLSIPVIYLDDYLKIVFWGKENDTM